MRKCKERGRALGIGHSSGNAACMHARAAVSLEANRRLERSSGRVDLMAGPRASKDALVSSSSYWSVQARQATGAISL